MVTSGISDIKTDLALLYNWEQDTWHMFRFVVSLDHLKMACDCFLLALLCCYVSGNDGGDVFLIYIFRQ